MSRDQTLDALDDIALAMYAVRGTEGGVDDLISAVVRGYLSRDDTTSAAAIELLERIGGTAYDWARVMRGQAAGRPRHIADQTGDG